MKKEQIITLVVFIIYMAFMIAVGVYFSRKSNKSQKEYALGNRSLNPWVTAMSAQASDMSGWLLMGLPGMVYLSTGNALEAVYIAIGLFIGTLLNWTLLAKRFRVYTEVAQDSITVSDYLVKRFHDDKKIIGLISGAIIIFFFTIYTSAMFAAGAKVFNQIFGLKYIVGLTIGAIVILAYTFLGGFQAVSWTDLFQGIIMFIAIVTVPLLAVAGMTGEAQAQVGQYIQQTFAKGNHTPIKILSGLAWGLGYFGMPHIITRFMAIKSKKLVRPARITAMIWVTISLFAALLVGFVGHVYIKDLTGGNEEKIFLHLIQSEVHIGIGAFLLTGLLAAIMSTADSELLVASTSFSNDIFKQHLKKNANDKQILRANKFVLLLVGVIAYLIALDPNSSIFTLVSVAWAGFGAAFGPIILCSLYFKNITKPAAVLSMVIGAVTTVSFYLIGKYNPSITFFQVYCLLPGFILSLVSIFVVTLITKNKIDKRILADFDEYIKKLYEDEQEDRKTKKFKKLLKNDSIQDNQNQNSKENETIILE